MESKTQCTRKNDNEADQQAINSNNTAVDTLSSTATPSSAPSQKANPSTEGNRKFQQKSTGRQQERRRTTYKSINVHAKRPYSTEKAHPGTMSIIWEDFGGSNDFYSISVHVLWEPRKNSTDDEQRTSTIEGFKISLDEVLTARILENRNSDGYPKIELSRWGGHRLPTLVFPNGVDAMMECFKALKEHLYMYQIEDGFRQGKIFAVEKVPRMRRVVPMLTTAEEDVSHDGSNTGQRTRRGQGRGRGGYARRGRRRSGMGETDREPGMVVLEEFAKVTRLARNFGENLILMFDEKRRREEDARKEREYRARQRALDWFAPVEVADDNRILPGFFKLEEPRGQPVTAEVWQEFFDENGCMRDITLSKRAVFAGGLEPEARPLAWPFLLKAYRWNSSAKERAEKLEDYQKEYERISNEWEDFSKRTEELDASFSAEEKKKQERAERLPPKECKFLQTKEQIAKDIVRTDRHMPAFNGDDSELSALMNHMLNLYAWHNDDIGYCQGMSDLLSPIIYVMGLKRAALGFWCFVSLMKERQENFLIDQSGIRAQLEKLKRLIKLADPKIALFFERTDPDLYTCFRWIIVQFKREFSFEDIAKLWEVFWAEQDAGDEMHLYVAVGLLQAHRRGILGLEIGAFDALLRYINDMSMRIDVDFALKHGEKTFRELSEKKKAGERRRVAGAR